MHPLSTALFFIAFSIIALSKSQTCDNGEDSLTGFKSDDKFDVALTLDCANEKVVANITYNDFTGHWFGILLHDQMVVSDAFIYTTGLNSNRTKGLYQYEITSYGLSGISYRSSLNEISTLLDNNFIQIIYEQNWTNFRNAKFSASTTQFVWRWAKGNSIDLVSKHGSKSNEPIIILLGDTTTTTTSTTQSKSSPVAENNLSMHIAHGVIMWLAWAVFASIGINISAHRWILKSQPKDSWYFWYTIHRTMQCIVVLLCLIGFILAVIFTEQDNNIHFDNEHMIIGLIVVILCILQPMNAYFKPPPVKFGLEKPISRFIWELVHKGFGYVAYILGCVNVYLGLKLPMISADILSYIHLFGWCGCLVLLYIVLWVIGCLKEGDTKQLKIRHEKINTVEEDDDIEVENDNTL